MAAPKFKITYATLSNTNPELHQMFDQALARVKGRFGTNYPLFINGEERWTEQTFEDRSPINTDWLLGTFQKGTRDHAAEALTAARAASAGWRKTPWQERIAIMRQVADLISERGMDISAAVTLEIGKNRLEALGDVEETADLIRWYCDEMERNNGFVKPMLQESPKHHNTNFLKPYGVWVVISPFNFPFALAGGPSGGALVAGNTVVFKPASDTPLSGWLLTECMRDAGVPAGVFNYVTGPGSTVGEELITNNEVDGITFTGSYDVGMHIYRTFAAGQYPRPCIAEMGGKNATIISRKADLDKAALGVMRSAFGLTGQKCSACSRVYVEEPVREAFLEKLVDLTKQDDRGRPLAPGDLHGTGRQQGRLPRLPGFRGSLAPRRQRVDRRRRHDRGRLRQGLLRCADHRQRPAAGPRAVEGGDVPAHRQGGRRRVAGAGDGAGQRQRLRPDQRLLQRGRRRGAVVPGQHRGRRGLRQPAGRRDHRRLAWLPGLRRLEGQRQHRQGRRQLLLRPAVHARAVADGDRLILKPG